MKVYRERKEAQKPIKIVKSLVEIRRKYNAQKISLHACVVDYNQQSASRLNINNSPIDLAAPSTFVLRNIILHIVLQLLQTNCFIDKLLNYGNS